MSDEEKRIEELEQQLKIAKMEKELAELKNENSQEQKPISKKKQKELNKELEEKEKQKSLDDVYDAFIYLGSKPTRETILEKLETTKSKLLISESFLLNDKEQVTYNPRVNWFSMLLYPCAVIAYLVAKFLQNPWRNSLIFLAMLFILGNPFSDKNTIIEQSGGTYCIKLHILDGAERQFCSNNRDDLNHFQACARSKALGSKAKELTENKRFNESMIYNECFFPTIYEKEQNQQKDIENPDGAIGDESASTGNESEYNDDPEVSVKTIEIYGIPVSYASGAFTKEEIQKYAQDCYDNNYTDKDSLNECVTNTIKGVPMKY